MRPGSVRLIAAAGAAAAVLAAAGCASVGYYAQAVRGHTALMLGREPIAELVDAEDTPSALRSKLTLMSRMREFAVDELALPDDGSYTDYVDTGRRYVTWTVVATPPFSLEPRQWCFPVAGCVSYRGYFAEADARAFSRGLEAEGLDVHVAGARAYSTLGWFDDPVLNTMLARTEFDLAGVLFHEMAHRRIYLPGDSTFNESYAVTVERAGVRAWLAANGGAAAIADYERTLARRAAFLDLVLDTRARLESVYAADRADEWKRVRKREAIASMRRSYDALVRRWGGVSPYARWFETDVNNAKLALVATYHALVPAFEILLSRLDGDMAAFHGEVDRLRALAPGERARALAAPGAG